ncbi:hypothetical protein HBB16_13365 [Pseudonocardia sp. MCCB 268]|nr:hypothetical protein [Pseudonocardia cytotoxica]
MSTAIGVRAGWRLRGRSRLTRRSCSRQAPDGLQYLVLRSVSQRYGADGEAARDQDHDPQARHHSATELISAGVDVRPSRDVSARRAATDDAVGLRGLISEVDQRAAQSPATRLPRATAGLGPMAVPDLDRVITDSIVAGLSRAARRSATWPPARPDSPSLAARAVDPRVAGTALTRVGYELGRMLGRGPRSAWPPR